MPKKILYAPSGNADRDIAPDLVPAGYELLECALGTAEMNAHLADAEFLVGFGAPQMNDAFFKMAPKLKLIQLLSAGYDRCDVEAARRAGVPIANNGGANAVAVAEHALMLMLAISRRLVWQHKSVSSGVWRGNDWQDKHVYELQGKMLGIIGLGTIGKKVARLAQAFGMRVQYYDTIRLNEDGEDAIGARFRLMDEVLATSDLVSLHVPLLADTKHMISTRELALMKSSASLQEFGWLLEGFDLWRNKPHKTLTFLAVS